MNKLSYTGAGILTSFPFTASLCLIKLLQVIIIFTLVNLKSVSDIGLGLTHPRRTKLQHETFLRFGHPRLEFENLSKTPCY